jgi:hypothetical protein
MVSNAHRRMDISDCAGNGCDIEIGAMHPNVGNSLPNAHNTKIIQSLIDIAKNTESYTCKICRKRKDNDYNLNNNLHPVWFVVNEGRSHTLDDVGKKIHTLRYHKS